MKRSILTSVFVFFLIAGSFAQGVVNNLVVFINETEPFTLIMNGERYNLTPDTRVRVTGLTLEKYRVKIVFTNSKLKDINTTLTFFSTGWECDFILNPHGNKKHTMDFFTQKRIEGFDQVNPSANENVNNTGNNTTDNNSQVNNTQNNQTDQSNQTNPVPPSTPTNTVLTGTGTFPVQNIPKIMDHNCDTPISEAQFDKYKSDIMKKVTDKDKKVIAFLMLENHCLLTNQVKQLVDMFVEDNVKLEVAKKAYHVTTDYSNYAKLTEAFRTLGVKDEFKKFLPTKK